MKRHEYAIYIEEHTPTLAIMDMLRYDQARVEREGTWTGSPDVVQWLCSSPKPPAIQRWASFGIKAVEL